MPISAASRPHFLKTRNTSSSRPFSATSSMRSWLSLSMISYGVMPVSRCGTRSSSISTPTSPRLPISPADHAGENPAVARAGLGIVGAAESQRIHDRDGPRAHGEDVAKDAADTGGRALKRLDEAGVIVRLDLECDDVAAADIDDAGVFA